MFAANPEGIPKANAIPGFKFSLASSLTGLDFTNAIPDLKIESW